MLNSVKALGVSLSSFMRRRVTADYPKTRIPLQDRFMGFPVLTKDANRDEPFCTGCGVCVRYCPTQCMSAAMKDNPKFADGDSHRKKIIDYFGINYGRCILCGICVDVCNFDAIAMSAQHEISDRLRDGNRMDLARLLEQGRKYQRATGWKQSRPSPPSPKEREAIAAAKAARTAESSAADASPDAKSPDAIEEAPAG
jgi:NADH-quinone oxidoreductase subunit I